MSIEALTQEHIKSMAKVNDKVKELADELHGRLERGEKNVNGLKESIDDLLKQQGETKSQMLELAQKLARPQGQEQAQAKSLGYQLVDNDEFKNLIENPRAVKNVKINVKSLITSATSDNDGSAGALVPTHRLDGIITPPQRLLTVRDLIMPGTTATNNIEYIQETGFTNNAAAQNGEGVKKAQSSLKYGEKSAQVKTLAHFIKVAKQVLDDAPQLASQINGRLIYGLKLVEEQQLLNGDGENGNIKGLIPQATTFSDKASLASYTIIDQLRLAMLQSSLAEYPVSGIVLNPVDWAKIELLKDANGRHIIGNPQGVANPTLWGVPVITTQAIGAGKFLTGAFDLGAQLFDREQASIQVGFENDDLTKNLVTILAEERLALAVYRPEAFIHGDLTPKG